MSEELSNQNINDSINLNNLPMEIKQQIMNNLSVSDMNNLRLTSRSLSNPNLLKNYINTNLKSV